MQALKLDYIADGRSIWVGMLLLALGIGVGGGALWHHIELNRKIAYQEALLASLQRRIPKAAPVEKRDGAQIAEETKMAHDVVVDLNRPWDALFKSFESTPHEDVALLAMEPDAKKGIVRISGEARSLESLLGYIADLQKIPLLREISLLNHQVQDQDPEKPVRFMIQAQWGGGQ
ncbi:MAG: PilN domain-containing protein [Burkholderiales bacterium]|nr:PilN domain-containing protein [Burkholderiales bacterium]